VLSLTLKLSIRCAPTLEIWVCIQAHYVLTVKQSFKMPKKSKKQLIPKKPKAKSAPAKPPNPPPQPKHPKSSGSGRRRPERGEKKMSMVEVKNREYAGALNVAKVIAEPSKTDAIRFPMEEDLKVGSVPVKETMNFTGVALSNTTFDAANGFMAFALQDMYQQPMYVGSAISNTGVITWSSIGSPSSYTSMTTNAALLRLNVVSIKFFDFTAELYKAGRVFMLQYQSQSASGITYPASVAQIVQNPMTKPMPLAKFKQTTEFVVNKEKISQLDFGYPTVPVDNDRSSVLIALVIYPLVTAGAAVPQAVEGILTMHYEYVPYTNYQILTEPAASRVDSEALNTVDDAIASATQAGGNQSADGPGFLERAVDIGKDIWNIANDVWDYASPLVEMVTGLFSFLGPHEPAVLQSFAIYQQFCFELHKAAPLIVTNEVLHALLKYPVVGLRSFRGALIEATHRQSLERLVQSCHKIVVSSCRHLLHPYFLNLKPTVKEVEYSFMKTAVIAPWKVSTRGGITYLTCFENSAAVVRSEDTSYAITFVSYNARIVGDTSPQLLVDVEGIDYLLDLEVSSIRQDFEFLQNFVDEAIVIPVEKRAFKPIVPKLELIPADNSEYFSPVMVLPERKG